MSGAANSAAQACNILVESLSNPVAFQVFRFFKADDTSCSSMAANTNCTPWLPDLGRRGTCDTDGLLHCLEKNELSISAFALGSDTTCVPSVKEGTEPLDRQPQMDLRRDHQIVDGSIKMQMTVALQDFCSNTALQPRAHERTNSGPSCTLQW